MRTVMILMVLMVGLTGQASAKAIENACLRSDREARSRQLCGCIQDAANLVLSIRDQRLASTFYSDPQRAQDVRQSGSRSNARFWERYKEYAEVARAFCE